MENERRVSALAMLRGSSSTEYRTSVLLFSSREYFNIYSDGLWSTLLASICLNTLEIFTRHFVLVRWTVHLNCASLDNHSISREPNR